MVAAPIELEGDDSAFAYLASRYDTDGDGSIALAEYDRGGAGFERLDRNSDGVITAADYESSGRGGGMRRQMQNMRALRIISRYFQHDENDAQLPREELTSAFGLYDANADDLLSKAEFENKADARHRSVPGDESQMTARIMDGVDPWEVLVEAADGDDDGSVSETELVAYFDERDDGDGIWNIRAPGGGRRGAGGGESARPVSGIAKGELAADFTLESIHGDDPVTLSDFRGDKPVALIFGSYT